MEENHCFMKRMRPLTTELSTALILGELKPNSFTTHHQKFNNFRDWSIIESSLTILANLLIILSTLYAWRKRIPILKNTPEWKQAIAIINQTKKNNQNADAILQRIIKLADSIRNNKISVEEVRFAEWCGVYDPYNIELGIIHHLAKIKGARIIDIGCGTGRLSFQLSEKAREVTGIDNDPKMITYCNLIKRIRNVRNTKFRVADMRKMPFKSSKFDLAIFAWALVCIDEMQKAILEARRITKPDGKIIVIDQWSGSDYTDIVMPFIGKYRKKPKVPYHIQIREVLRKENFRQLTPRPISVPYLFPTMGSALSTFEYAITNWHKTPISQDDRAKLVNILKQYETKKGIIVNEKITGYGFSE
jgi:ubiquinone/menaquinone biosynthesis C-methylase UbiE